MAVSFDLFGTLVAVDRPADPARAVADELVARDVDVPDDWGDAYAEPHVDAPEGAEVPLPAHVSAALRSRDVEFEPMAVRRAIVAAFDPEVRTRSGASEAIAAAGERGPVAICSNCSVPELAARTLIRADLDRTAFDAVVTSVACGWRKPAPGIFEATAAQLGVEPRDLVHVGDDPDADGGIEELGGTFVSIAETPLEAIPDRLEALSERADGEGDRRGNDDRQCGDRRGNGNRRTEDD